MVLHLCYWSKAFRAYGAVGNTSEPGEYLLFLPCPSMMCVDVFTEVVFNTLSLLLFGRGDKKVICNKFIQTVQFRLVPGKLG